MRILAGTLMAALLAGAVPAAAGEGGAKRGPIDVDGDGRVTVVCFGDSTTKGSLFGAYPVSLRALLAGQAEVVNAGKFGDKATSAVGRLPGVLDQKRADYVVLLLGVNDVLGLTSREACAVRAAGVVDSVRAMAAEVRRRGAVPVVGTVFVSPALAGGLPAECAERINVELRALPERGVDFAAVMRGRYDELTQDGVHPNAAGARAQATAVAAALEPPRAAPARRRAAPRHGVHRAGLAGGAAARCAERLNAWVRAQPEERVDFEAALHGRIPALTTDGVHPNGAGYRALAEAAARVLGTDGPAGR